MEMPFEWQIGWRFARVARGSQRHGFLSFISAISVLGIALGVAALIIVLSVMNGFQKEVRDRMLGVIPHIELSDAQGRALQDASALSASARAVDPRIVGAAPVVVAQALLARGELMRGAVVRGIEPAQEAEVTELGRRLKDSTFAALRPGSRAIVLGSELARQLGVRQGDALAIVAPDGQPTGAGTAPRLLSFTVAGTFDAGHFEYDSTLALIHLEDAGRVFRVEGPTGMQLKLSDPAAAAGVASRLVEALPVGLGVRDWTRSNRHWFEAVQQQKRLMALILTLIVAVAAFNLVSMLVMTVTDKQADIAILRTLGASPGAVMRIFVVQGATAGVLGTLGGVAGGLLVALNIDVIVPAFERLLGVQFLQGNVYLIERMPSQPLAADVLPIALTSVLLSLLATLYPSWRASRVQPAQALRGD